MPRLKWAVLIVAAMGLLSCAKQDKLTFMHFWTSEDVRPTIKQLIAQFEQEHPGIEVQLVDLNWSNGRDKITIALATHTAADLIELGSDWIAEYAVKGMIEDLSTAAQAYSDSLLGWNAAEIAGKVYGFPWMLGTRVLYFNGDLMARVGLDPNNPPVTWDELYADCAKINALGPPIYGFGSNAYEKFTLYKKFLPFLWGNGGDILNGANECALTMPAAVQALEFYTKLSDIGYLESQRVLDDKFLAGELGFVISGDWILRRIQHKQSIFNLGACLMPRPDKRGGKRASFLGGEFLTINAASPRKDQALELLKFLVSKEADLAFCRAAGSVNPANLQAAEAMQAEAGPLAGIFLQQIKTALPPPVHPRWVDLQFVVEEAVQNAIYHKGTASSVLSDACERINRILHEQ